MLLALAFFVPASAQSPETTLGGFVVALNATEKAGASTPYARRFAALAPAIDAAFDLSAILKTVVGLAYEPMAEPDRTALLAAFRDYTICNYVTNFSGGDTVALVQGSRVVGAEQIVRTTVGTPPTAIDYVLRESGSGWRVVDVLEDGSISQAAVQRSDFRSVLQGGAAALTASLKRKVEALSGGTIKP